MNQREITQYLSASRIAVMATINKDGTPQLTPNWYNYDGKVLTFITTKDRLKYLNLRRNKEISVCIYDEPEASDYVVIKGTATISDQDIWDEARRIAERYNEPEHVDEYLEMWKKQPRVIVTVTPQRISTRYS